MKVWKLRQNYVNDITLENYVRKLRNKKISQNFLSWIKSYLVAASVSYVRIMLQKWFTLGNTGLHKEKFFQCVVCQQLLTCLTEVITSDYK